MDTPGILPKEVRIVAIFALALLFIFSATSTSLTASLTHSRIFSELIPPIFFVLFLYLFFQYGKLRIIDHGHAILLVGVLGYASLYSILVAYEEPLRLIYLAKYVLISLAFFFVFRIRESDVDWILYVVKFFILMMAFYSVFSILNVFFGYSCIEFSAQFNRGSGGQVGTISYAATMVMAMPLIPFLRNNKYIFAVVPILIAGGIVASGGRAAYISLILYVVIASKSLFPSITRHFSAILLIAVIVFLGTQSDRIFSLFLSESGGDLQRLGSYFSFFDVSRGWEIISGLGVGQTSPGIKHLSGYSFLGYESYILNILGELGLAVGIVFGLLILLRVVNLSRRHCFYASFFIPQVPIFALQIAHENFTVLCIFCGLVILLACIPEKVLDRYYSCHA